MFRRKSLLTAAIIALLVAGVIPAVAQTSDAELPVVTIEGIENSCHSDQVIARIVVQFATPGEVTMRAQAYTDYYDEITTHTTDDAGMLEVVVNAPSLPEYSIIQYGFSKGDPEAGTAETVYVAINCTTGLGTQGRYYGNDGRVAAGLDVPVVFYPLLNRAGEPYWEFYTVDADDPESRGQLSLRLTPAMLEQFERRPAQNTAIATTRDNLATLYRLTTGQLQVNYAPDEEGKVFVVIFDGNRPRIQRADFDAS